MTKMTKDDQDAFDKMVDVWTYVRDERQAAYLQEINKAVMQGFKVTIETRESVTVDNDGTARKYYDIVGLEIDDGR